MPAIKSYELPWYGQPNVLPMADLIREKVLQATWKKGSTTVDDSGFSGRSGNISGGTYSAEKSVGAKAPAVENVAVAQGVPSSAADVRSVPTSLGAAFQVPSGSLGDTAWSNLQSIIGQLSANSARATAESQAFAREQMAYQTAANAKAMEFSAEQARLDREWQKMMSDTAHQREVADLQAAGLNPILSAMGGNGASVGSGAMASGVSSAGSKGEVFDTNAAISGVLSSVLSGLMGIEVANINARTQESVADKYTAMSQIVESMREGFEAQYPSNVWRALTSALNDMAGSESGWYSKWLKALPVFDFR